MKVSRACWLIVLSVCFTNGCVTTPDESCSRAAKAFDDLAIGKPTQSPAVQWFLDGEERAIVLHETDSDGIVIGRWLVRLELPSRRTVDRLVWLEVESARPMFVLGQSRPQIVTLSVRGYLRGTPSLLEQWQEHPEDVLARFVPDSRPEPGGRSKLFMEVDKTGLEAVTGEPETIDKGMVVVTLSDKMSGHLSFIVEPTKAVYLRSIRGQGLARQRRIDSSPTSEGGVKKVNILRITGTLTALWPMPQSRIADELGWLWFQMVYRLRMHEEFPRELYQTAHVTEYRLGPGGEFFTSLALFLGRARVKKSIAELFSDGKPVKRLERAPSGREKTRGP